jgi:hypothetical protein
MVKPPVCHHTCITDSISVNELTFIPQSTVVFCCTTSLTITIVVIAIITHITARNLLFFILNAQCHN